MRHRFSNRLADRRASRKFLPFAVAGRETGRAVRKRHEHLYYTRGGHPGIQTGILNPTDKVMFLNFPPPPPIFLAPHKMAMNSLIPVERR